MTDYWSLPIWSEVTKNAFWPKTVKTWMIPSKVFFRTTSEREAEGEMPGTAFKAWHVPHHTVPGTRRLTRTGSGPIADEHRDMEVEEDDDYEAFLASVFVGRKCEGEVLYQHTYLEVECSFVFFLAFLTISSECM